MRGHIASCVRAYIFRLEMEALFTTQELLIFGNRRAVDQCLWRLRKAGYLKKIGNGLHLKCNKFGNFRQVTTEEAIKKRASVDGRKVVVHSTKDGKQFLINGRSSTVTVNGEKINLKQASRRKLKLGESKAGSLLRQFWMEGKIQAQSIWDDGEKISRFQYLGESDREELREAAPHIPNWLNEAVNKKYFGRFLDKKDRLKRLSAIQDARENQEIRENQETREIEGDS